MLTLMLIPIQLIDAYVTFYLLIITADYIQYIGESICCQDDFECLKLHEKLSFLGLCKI